MYIQDCGFPTNLMNVCIQKEYLANGVEINIELLSHLAEDLRIDITNITKGEAKFLHQ